MAQERFKRKLAAILSADVVGYSRLMEDNEEATIQTLNACRKSISKLIQQNRGRLVDATGDNLMAEFSSVVDAVGCAVEIQKKMADRNAELPENRRMLYRIGVNLGDIVAEDDKIYGDGVNIAARLESLAEAGGICISRTVYGQVKNKLDLGYEYLGEHSVKNISEPVHVYKVLMEADAAGKVFGETRKTKRGVALAIALIFLVGAGGLAGWYLYLDQSRKIAPASVENMAYSLPEKPSIAVLPFENMSADPKQVYFSNALTDQIITTLSKFQHLFVIAQQSTSVYKEKHVNIQKVAEELGVRYVLEGGVQKSGDKVRITAQLIDAITGRYIWSERYDREGKDLFALQDEITIKILNGMSIELTEGEQARRWTKVGTDNLEALEKHYQGMVFMETRGTKENNDKAIELFEEAVALDPKFVWPYVYLGYSHYIAATTPNWSESPDRSMEIAFELAQKALAIDDLDDRPHSLLGDLYLQKHQYDKALSEGERAVALNPNGALAYFRLAAIVGRLGRWDESALYAKKAIRLNPFPGIYYYFALGHAYFMTGQYDDAVVTCKKMLEKHPDNIHANILLTASNSSLGRDAEATASAKEILRINPKFNVTSMAKRLSYKNKADLERLVAALLKAGLPE